MTQALSQLLKCKRSVGVWRSSRSKKLQAALQVLAQSTFMTAWKRHYLGPVFCSCYFKCTSTSDKLSIAPEISNTLPCYARSL